MKWIFRRWAVGLTRATCLLVVLWPVLSPGRGCFSNASQAWLPGWAPERQSLGQKVTAEADVLPPWVVVYPDAAFVVRRSGSTAAESGYFTLATNDAPSTAFNFYKQTYEEKIDGIQFAFDFRALAPHYAELWLTGTSGETVRVAMVSATAAASPVSTSQVLAGKTFIYVSYTQGTRFESAYHYPMNEIGDLADLDFQPIHFECELDSDERFLYTREYLKAIHFVHRQHLTSRVLEFGPLIEAGLVGTPALEPALENVPGQPDKLPPWVVIYPEARVLARAVDAKKISGTLILTTDQSQEQVYTFYNQQLKELYRSFGLERSSWSQDTEFSTADWTNGTNKLLSIITLQDKSPQTVILLRYKGKAPKVVKPHRRHPVTRRS
ncbi:MAG: hypothetical protein ACUVR8_04425 [Acidobacteriota bacterium]